MAAEPRLATVWSAPLAAPLAALMALAALPGPGAADGAGPLHLVSLTEWREPHKGFGGFSGLALDPDGAGFTAVTDRGMLVRATLGRDADGRIAQVRWTSGDQLLDTHGQPVAGFTADAEALRRLPDGRLVVAYEGLARVTALTPPELHPTLLHPFDRFRAIWGNEGLESLAARPDGSLIAIEELPGPDGAYRTHVMLRSPVWAKAAPLASDGAFMATDAVWAPDGRLLVLERNFAAWRGFTTRISAYRPDGAGFGAPERLWQSPAGAYGDFEGMDVTALPGGGLRVTLIADNNFLPVTPTTLAELEMGPGNRDDGKTNG